MKRASCKSWPVSLGGRHQKGQALIYGIFVLVACLVVLFFLFNTGQLSREKTKLVNASDAVAYSAGVMHARALNFHATTNRAMVANTVAIAQLVSLSSWLQYTDTMSQYGFVLQNPKFSHYDTSYQAAQNLSSVRQELEGNNTLRDLAQESDRLIGLMAAAQSVVHVGLAAARHRVMDEVAQANYRNDGTVTAQELPTSLAAYHQLVQRFDGNDRQRFADVVTTATNRDRFVPRRSWDLPAQWADCASASPRVDWLDRRGGTQLIGFDEWKSLDTMAEKRWVPRSKFDVLCGAVAETPVAWGYRAAADNPSSGVEPMHHDMSLLINPTPTLFAVGMSSNEWGYSGLPPFHELREDARGNPSLRFSVRLMRPVSQTVTSEGRAEVRNTSRLNAYRADPAGGDRLVAVSTSEAFFSREQANGYGQSLGRPRESGSLFNPFWQVRLVSSQADVLTARRLQGVLAP